MKWLISILFICLSANLTQAKSPHGNKLHMDCDVCHSTNGWNTIILNEFNHDKTKFPLKGQHYSIDCKTCHSTLIFDDAESDCFSCHQDVHEHTLGSDCARCHTSNSWLVNNVNHLHQNMGFALTGVHRTVDCAECHKSSSDLRFDRIGNECFDCHKQDFYATLSPNHIQAGYSKNCLDCHSQTASDWTGVALDHSFFPLSNAHNLNCNECHSSGVYQGLPNTCESCHLTDYNSTTNPSHSTAGYSKDCEQCHNTSNWGDAVLDHSFFPLSNAHNLNCNECHSSGVYQGLANTCESCHLTDYNSTTNPTHSTAGYSKDCEQCHNTSNWGDADFNHDANYFPIYSGEHKGEWNNCVDCHTNPSNYLVFSCTNCHEHNKSDMDDEHNDVRNYVYNSTNCLACHPIGRADD